MRCVMEKKNLTEINPGMDKPKNEKVNLSEVGDSGPRKKDTDEKCGKNKKTYLRG